MNKEIQRNHLGLEQKRFFFQIDITFFQNNFFYAMDAIPIVFFSLRFGHIQLKDDCIVNMCYVHEMYTGNTFEEKKIDASMSFCHTFFFIVKLNTARNTAKYTKKNDFLNSAIKTKQINGRINESNMQMQ